MASSNYGCSQPDLYNAVRIAWKAYLDNVDAFTQYSPFYKVALGTQKLADVDAADRLPDKAARQSVAKNARLELATARDGFMYQFGLLKSYINRIYQGSKRDLTMEAIGDGYAAKANSGNVGSLTALISSAVPYVEDNIAELTASNIMPPTFLAQLQAAAKATTEKYDAALAADQAVADNTDSKINANNALYADVKLMLTDAQSIFKNDANTLKLFVWATILDKTHGTRNAGVGGKITLDGTKNALAGVRVRILNTEKLVITDGEGRFEIAPLSMGSYTAIIEKEGYETLTLTFEIKTGVTTRLNGALKMVV